MGERPDPEGVLAMLGDEYVRTIIRAASRGPMSVKELSDACDSAPSTVYRRVDDLVEAGLLFERTEIEPDGSHHSVYETRMDELRLAVDDGRLELELVASRDAAEQFTRLWEDIRGA